MVPQALAQDTPYNSLLCGRARTDSTLAEDGSVEVKKDWSEWRHDPGSTQPVHIAEN